MMPLFDFPGGIHPPENKAQSSATPIRQAPLPTQLHVALRQSMGNAARPCVAVGDRVAKGQLIATADGRLSAAVHAPTSGVVSAITPQPFAHPSGLPELCITLDSDGEERWIARQPLYDWPQRSGAEIRDFLAQMGIVGLGGAVFPSHLKLGVSLLETLVINGAECEPYISCDDRLMRERATAICDGIAVTRHALQARQVLIGIEDNKPQAIAAMQAAAAVHGYRVVAVPTKYPSGGAKQLIRILTGKAIPHGVRATEHGVQCFNVATVYAIGRAVLHGEPLISRIVTLTGAVDAAANVEALIGTPLASLLALARPHHDSKEVVMGGPLMGFTLPDLAAGLTKAGNCLLVKSPALFPPRPPAQACIRCGDCASACPVSLQPMDLFWFAKAKNFDKAQQWQLFDCIECGACSYGCPSQIPLVDYYRFAKSEIWAAERDKNAANLARQRHEFRQFRLQRDKAEKAQRLADKAAAQAAARQTEGHSVAANLAPNNVAPSTDPKQAAIAAAMARAAAQREAAPLPEQHSSGLNDAKQAAIAAAMARAAARKNAADEAKAAGGQPPTPPPQSSGLDDAKQAAIAAAMARATARKSAADEARAASGQPPAPPPTSSGLDDAKQAAIAAAMARAAARKAAADQAKANQQPDS